MTFIVQILPAGDYSTKMPDHSKTLRFEAHERQSPSALFAPFAAGTLRQLFGSGFSA
jgi:hypothetical protein